MQIVNIGNKEQLNEFVGAQKHSQFLQSWQWGEFHKNLGSKVFRLGIEDGGRLMATVTIIKKILPMGRSYFYCPRGPAVKLEVGSLPADAGRGQGQKSEVVKLLFEEIKKIAESEGVIFLRFEPIIDHPQPLLSKEGGERNILKTLDVQPSKTLILDLSKPEKELLKDMHQKTRYNVRLAEKKGVKIIEAGIERFDEFWQIMAETSERDSFRLHGIDYYKEMLRINQKSKIKNQNNLVIKIFFAEYRKKVIAANIVSFFGDMVTYMHGASANEHRNVMAPHLLQWQVIKLAKEQGYKYYDFYGIDESRWPGITRFKKGFSGKEIKYPGTFDLIFDSGWYSVYKMVRKVRRTF